MSSLLVNSQPTHWWDGVRSRKDIGYESTTQQQKYLCIMNSFQDKFKTQPHIRYYEEN